MGDNSDPAPLPEPAPPETTGADQAIEEEVGDFISGHVLEKDSVFFEG